MVCVDIALWLHIPCTVCLQLGTVNSFSGVTISMSGVGAVLANLKH